MLHSDQRLRRSRRITRRQWLAWIAGLGIFAVAAISSARAYLRSPDYISRRAMAALQQRDGLALVALADPDEVRRLGIHPAAVSGLLTELMGTGGRRPTSIRRRKMRDDLVVWEVHIPANGANARHDRLLIPVIDDPRAGWRLNLSFMLRSLCYWGRPGQQAPALYRALAAKYSIGGLRRQNGDYVTLAEMSAIAEQASR